MTINQHRRVTHWLPAYFFCPLGVGPLRTAIFQIAVFVVRIADYTDYAENAEGVLGLPKRFSRVYVYASIHVYTYTCIHVCCR